MWGGHGHRGFYFNEIKRIEKDYKDNAPPSGYSEDEVSAGYPKLAEKFGFYSTLLFMEVQTQHKRSELTMWSVSEFQYNLLYISWKAYFDKKYADIIKAKK